MRLPVRIHYRAPATAPPPTRVELYGEMADWLSGQVLPLTHDGSFATELELPVGVDAYKLRVDGSWTLDPSNPRTRSAAGHRNNVAVVGGLDEPFLHAPAPPFLEELDRGTLRLLFGVRGRAEGIPLVVWSEGDEAGIRRLESTFAFEEDEHRFFEAELPASARVVRYAFELHDGTRSEEMVFARSGPRRTHWLRDASVYAIYVDRFRPERDRPDWERDPGANVLAGGHLEGIRRSLDELQDLGVDTLYLTPVHVGRSSHRYDVVDALRVDPILGGEEAYARLVEDLHSRSMKLLQDVSFAHAGEGFPPYEDVRLNGEVSKYAPWFSWSEDSPKTLRHYGKRTDAPLLNLTCEDVEGFVLDIVRAWARRGVDGLRLDMTAEVPLSLGRRIRDTLRETRPDAVVLGGVVPAHAWRWRVAGVVDAATDFDFHSLVTDMVGRGKLTPRAFVDALRERDLRRGGDGRSSTLRFTATHDHVRLATQARHEGRAEYLPLAYALLYSLPGIRALLYGEEVGLSGRDVSAEPENVWPDRAPMPWRRSLEDDALRSVVRAWATGRRASVALRQGDFQVLHADESLLVFRRAAENEVLDVVMNLSGEDARISVEDDERPVVGIRAEVGRVHVRLEDISLGPRSAVLLERRAERASRATTPERVRHNLVVLERAFVEASAAVLSRPTRLDFAVTERCNLKCLHCITHAPERTADGTARTLSPAVLDTLRDDLAYASYCGFVHGGESLTAPIFFDVLTALRHARPHQERIVHVLTNGLLLSATVAERLVDGGVRSLSVSLDGATAEVNDSIRQGGRFSRVIHQLETVLALRKARAWDLRVGLSFVVLKQNVHELAAFVDLAAALGVDWIKLEEGVPATPYAARSLLRYDEADTRENVERALDRARNNGLVAVDHTRTQALWRCRMDHETSQFLKDDEFANRSSIHPCRTPWETACIEPNGDVRMGDFFGPILGNVTRTPLRELWNCESAMRERERSARARLCAPHGPVTCVP